MVMACKIKLYYPESDLFRIYVSLGIKNYRRLIIIVDLLSLQTHIFWGYQYVKAYISSRIRFDGYYSKIPISDQYFSLISFTSFEIFVHVDIW